MLKSNLIRDHRTTILVLLFTLCNCLIIEAAETNSTTSTSASASSCTPLNCVPVCTPTCGIQEACVLRTMTNCAVCPASRCFDRSTLGLPPAPTSSMNDQPSSSNSSNNAGLIGGVVGGLVGVGILICIGVYCYIRRAKRKRKLPFAFTEGGMGIMSQEKFQPTLAQQEKQQSRTIISPPNTEPNRFISLSELANNSTPINNRSPISNNNQSSLNHDVPVNNTNNQNSTTNDIMTSPVIASSVVPEEFEERIALQNKRISQILHNNPRLSRGSTFNQTQPPIIENRTSGISFTTTDDDGEYDDDDKSISSYNTQQATIQSRSPYQHQLSSQAVQVTRAKAQIMRVNSVRSNSGGLGRSESVRTILTSLNNPPTLPQLDLAGDSLLTDSFPATPNNRSFATIEDPFLDTEQNDTKK